MFQLFGFYCISTLSTIMTTFTLLTTLFTTAHGPPSGTWEADVELEELKCTTARGSDKNLPLTTKTIILAGYL